MKPGDRLKGPKVCRPGRSCAALDLVLKETREHSPKTGGAGLQTSIGLSDRKVSTLTTYRTGKGTRKNPATTIAIKFCPFCGAALSYEAAIEREESQKGPVVAAPLSPHRAAMVARESLVVWMVDHHEAMIVDDVPGLGPDDGIETLAAFVRKRLIVDELPEGLQQDLGLAHLDTCGHYLCPSMPCDGGEGCNWTKEKRYPAPKCCGVKS